MKTELSAARRRFVYVSTGVIWVSFAMYNAGFLIYRWDHTANGLLMMHVLLLLCSVINAVVSFRNFQRWKTKE